MPRAIQNQEAETSCCSHGAPVQGLSVTGRWTQHIGWTLGSASMGLSTAGVVDTTKITSEQKTKVP